MDPSYIYFKEINIDQDNTFTGNSSKDNEIENVVFNKENKYGVSGLNINAVLPDEKILKIENKREQDKISREIQELIKQNKESNLIFIISHPETKCIEIPFVKKMKQNCQRKNWLSLIPTPKKNEDFTFYNYVGHLEKFGYEWNKDDFKYEKKIKNQKIIKKLTLEKQQRIDFNVDESRIFNVQTSGSFFDRLITFSMGYFENISLLKRYFKISGKKFDFTRLPILKKHTYLGEYSLIQHKNKPYIRRIDDLYSIF